MPPKSTADSEIKFTPIEPQPEPAAPAAEQKKPDNPPDALPPRDAPQPATHPSSRQQKAKEHSDTTTPAGGKSDPLANCPDDQRDDQPDVAVPSETHDAFTEVSSTPASKDEENKTADSDTVIKKDETTDSDQQVGADKTEGSEIPDAAQALPALKDEDPIIAVVNQQPAALSIPTSPPPRLSPSPPSPARQETNKADADIKSIAQPVSPSPGLTQSHSSPSAPVSSPKAFTVEDTSEEEPSAPVSAETKDQTPKDDATLPGSVHTVTAQPAPLATPSLVPMPQTEKTISSTSRTPYTNVPMEIGLAVLDGQRSIHIRLTPADLGTIEIELTVSDDHKVDAKIEVDDTQVLAMMRTDAPLIRQALEQTGLITSPDSLSFSLRQEGSSTSERHGHEKSSHQKTSDRGQPDEGDATTGPQAPIPVMRRATSRLDLNI